MATTLVSKPVFTENMIILLMIVSLFLNPVRDRWSRKMRVAAIHTSATALRALIDFDIGKIELSWRKLSNEYLGDIILVLLSRRCMELTFLQNTLKGDELRARFLYVYSTLTDGQHERYKAQNELNCALANEMRWYHINRYSLPSLQLR